jgi:hypothetical protein
MQELEKRETQSSAPPVFLRLTGTDFPEPSLPRGNKGRRLTLPAAARLQIEAEGIRIDLIVDDDDRGGYYDQDYEPPDFDDVDPPLITLNLRREAILRLVTDRRGRYTTSDLVISDPTGVVEGFTLTFESTDRNNPGYWTKLLAKLVGERLAVSIEELMPEPRRPDDIPF